MEQWSVVTSIVLPNGANHPAYSMQERKLYSYPAVGVTCTVLLGLQWGRVKWQEGIPFTKCMHSRSQMIKNYEACAVGAKIVTIKAEGH